MCIRDSTYLCVRRRDARTRTTREHPARLRFLCIRRRTPITCAHASRASVLLLLLLHVCIGSSVDPASRRRVPTLHRIAIGGRAHGRRRGSAAASEARGGTPTRMHGCGPLAHARPRHATPPATRHTAPPTTDAAPRLAHAGICTATRSRRFLRTPSTGCRRLLPCACPQRSSERGSRRHAA